MELKQIEKLLEKYEDGNTSIAEEQQLKQYFLTNSVPKEWEHYVAIFGVYNAAKKEHFSRTIAFSTTQKKGFSYYKIGIAASLALLLGIGLYQDLKPKPYLGTFDNPEEAFAATQEALFLLSEQINQGVESVTVLGEYEQSKQKVFKITK